MKLSSLIRTSFVSQIIFAVVLLPTLTVYAGGGGGGSQNSSSTNSVPQTGTQGVSSVSIGGTILAYQSARMLGTNIAVAIEAKTGTNNGAIIYITTTPPNSSGLQAVYLYEKDIFGLLISNYLENANFERGFYRALHPEKPVPSNPDEIRVDAAFLGPETASDLASAASTVLSLFRTSITATDNSITPDNLGLLPSLCDKLREDGLKPITADFNIDGNPLSNPNSLLSKMMQLAKLRAYASRFVTNTDQSLTNEVANIATLNSTYDNIFTNLATVPLASLIPLDFMYSALSGDNVYLLYLSNNYMAGETRVKSNPIIDIFFDGPRTSFIGSAGASYFLFAKDNAVPVLSDHVDGYQGYRKFNKMTWWYFVHNDIGN